MKMGIVGLGRMGHAVAQRVINAGHEVVGFDLNKDAQKTAKKSGVQIVNTLEELAKECRIIWLMVPAGDVVDTVIKTLTAQLQMNDIIIDGGNSFFKNSMRRAQQLAQQSVFYLDCGTSGGVHGLKNGFCLMIGGNQKAFQKVQPLFEVIAAPGGFGYMGQSGTGHYVKMVHNGIEYGLLQAYAEGFHIIKDGYFKQENLDLEKITSVWQSSSVIRSFILELAHNVFQQDQSLKDVYGAVAEGGSGKTGMGTWTMQEAHEHGIPAPIVEQTLKTRAWSRETGGNYTTKMIAMFRNQFGGHEVKKISEKKED